MFCEGGGQLAATLLRQDLVTELVTFTAGKAIGAEGRPAIGEMNLARLTDAKGFALVDTAAAGGDVVSRWRR